MYTQGKWLVGENRALESENFLCPVIGVEGSDEGICVFPDSSRPEEERESNVRLISQSPYLHQMALELKSLLEEIGQYTTQRKVLYETVSQILDSVDGKEQNPQK